jgi:cytochrome b561
MQARMVYGRGARGFHWLTVALLLIIMPMGIVMGDLPRGPLQDALFITHESLGITVLALTVLRFFWRLGHRPPPPSPDLSRLEVGASGSVHALLYLVLVVTPITGYLFISFLGINFSYVGLVDLRPPVAADKPTGEFIGAVHASMQWAIYALVAMHVGAALHHYIFRRNDVLQRMLPGLRQRSGAKVAPGRPLG